MQFNNKILLQALNLAALSFSALGDCNTNPYPDECSRDAFDTDAEYNQCCDGMAKLPGNIANGNNGINTKPDCPPENCPPTAFSTGDQASYDDCCNSHGSISSGTLSPPTSGITIDASLAWWIWLLIIGGIAIIVAVVVFIVFYCNKKNRRQNAQIQGQYAANNLQQGQNQYPTQFAQNQYQNQDIEMGTPAIAVGLDAHEQSRKNLQVAAMHQNPHSFNQMNHSARSLRGQGKDEEARRNETLTNSGDARSQVLRSDGSSRSVPPAAGRVPSTRRGSSGSSHNGGVPHQFRY